MTAAEERARWLDWMRLALRELEAGKPDAAQETLRAAVRLASKPVTGEGEG